MKNLLTGLSILMSTFAISQTVSGFEHIYIPQNFEKKLAEYNLDSTLSKAFVSKKYNVIQDNPENWPTELKLNNCSIAKALLKDDSSFFKNKLKLEIVDCNNKVLQDFKASSNEKEFDKGYMDALKQIIAVIPASSPTVKNQSNVAVPIPAPAPVYVESPTVTKPDTTKPVAKNIYTNGTLNLQFISINSQQFILVSNGSDKAFATFKASTLANVFHVLLENGTSTIGYIENGQIVIDVPSNDQQYKKEIFVKK